MGIIYRMCYISSLLHKVHVYVISYMAVLKFPLFIFSCMSKAHIRWLASAHTASLRWIQASDSFVVPYPCPEMSCFLILDDRDFLPPATWGLHLPGQLLWRPWECEVLYEGHWRGGTAGAFLDKLLSKRQNNKWYRIATVLLRLMCVHQAGKLEMGKQRDGVLVSFMDFLTMEDQTSHTLAQCQNEILQRCLL